MRHRPRVLRTVVALAGLVGGLALAPLFGGTAAGSPGATASKATHQVRNDITLPGRIGAKPGVLQMVTVTSAHWYWHRTTGMLSAWQRPRGGLWTRRYGPLPVVLGYNGWVVADERVQSTGTTPAGRFEMPSAFGVLTNPGTDVFYRHVDSDDWWPYEPRDPATYNIYQYRKDSHSHWRAGYAERLASYQTQYAYAIVVGFNLPTGVHYSPERNQRVADHPANTALGGGIFLHVRGSGNTAGCVAMDQVHMLWLLHWLNPGKKPKLVMGPYHYVLTL